MIAARTTRRVRSALLLCVALPLLSGCGGYSTDNFRVGSVQGTYKTRHPIVIDERERTTDLVVASDALTLPRAQQSAVEGFAYAYRRAPSGNVTILVPQNSPNAGAARHLTGEVSEILRREGVPPASITVAGYDASRHGAAAPIRLSTHAVTAKVERCGKWPGDLAGPNLDNANWHNFGCASQNNMAAQIANPSDLVAPRGVTQSDAQRRAAVIDNYRNGTNLLPPPSSTVFTGG